MRLIQEDLGLTAFANKGIDLAKSHGKGNLRWSMDGIIVDKDTGTASNVYLYLFDKNVLFFCDEFSRQRKSVILELESSDSFEIYDHKSFLLTEIYKAVKLNDADQKFSVYSVGGTAFIVIGNRYIVSPGMTVLGDSQSRNDAIYSYDSADFFIKTQNLIALMQKMQLGQNFEEGNFIGRAPKMTNFYEFIGLFSNYLLWIVGVIIIFILILSFVLNIF